LHLLDVTTGELRYVLETATFQSAVPRGLPPAVNDLYQRFDTAIREERLIPPARDSAWDAYLAMRSQLSANIRGAVERRLAVAMGDRSQRIILKYLRGGDIKWNASIFDEGATLFTRVQQLYRQLPDLDSGRFFFEGRALIERNKYDDAVQRLERSVSLEPNASHSLNAIGLALWKQNRLNLATQPLQQAIAVTPRWNYPRNTLSLTYMEQRRYAEAENVFQLAINNDPEDSTAHHGLAQLYLLLNRRDEAETQLQGAIEFNPGNAYAYESYGKLRQLQGRLSEAEDYLRLAIRLEPDEPAFRATLAGMLQGQAGRAAEAADMFGQLARLDTDSVAVATALVPFFAQPDQFRQGDEFFDRSIKRSSGDPNMRVVYGGLLLKRGRFKSAERQFRAAVRRNPENPFTTWVLHISLKENLARPKLHSIGPSLWTLDSRTRISLEGRYVPHSSGLWKLKTNIGRPSHYPSNQHNNKNCATFLWKPGEGGYRGKSMTPAIGHAAVCSMRHG
jgi:Flp pilus assembly protein TadD